MDHPPAPLPAWRRRTQGETRWVASAFLMVAIGLQVALPHRFGFHPWWLLPAVQALLAVALIVANQQTDPRAARSLRKPSILLIGVVSLANAWSAGVLVHGLVEGTAGHSAGPLLLTGGAIWLTNVIVFALWYWELDRGGPVARGEGLVQYPDFQFAQMSDPHLAPPDWEPAFVDYFYLSFTNATAFSPTDVLPLTPWAKLTMLLQSGVSLVTVALVVARAVNILK